jgi:hemolysin activation/secretion protein
MAMKTTGATRILSAAMISLLVLGAQSSVWAEAMPRDEASILLNQERQRQEQERIAQRIAEGRNQSSITEPPQAPQEEEGPVVRFTLKEVQTNPSTVLTAAELKAVKDRYVGKDVSTRDLYALVTEINKLYAQKGYLTCRALMLPQTIKDGIVKLELVEGKTGTVEVQGNKSTRKDYIRNRVHLTEDRVANISQLDKDLQRFGATNDVQLRLVMRAGRKLGTTDYVIQTFEPKKYSYGLFSDNMGNDSTGLYRGGFYFQDKSLTGRRDNLYINGVMSKGMRGLTTSYTVPIARDGSKFGVTYGVSRTRNITGIMETLNTRGYSRNLTLSLTHPLKTTGRVKAEAGLEYGYQNSRTVLQVPAQDGSGAMVTRPWLDNTINSLRLYVDQIYYGDSYVFYQKHAYQFGDYTDVAAERNHFDKYAFNTYYQKRYRHNQTLSGRIDGQISGSNYLPSAEQFYIGGMYTVRGYKESLLTGTGGICGSVEYEVPLPKHPAVRGYAFFDAGRIWGDSDSVHSLSLAGTGVGLKASLAGHVDLNLCLAFPLARTIDYSEQGKTRIHFSLYSRF